MSSNIKSHEDFHPEVEFKDIGALVYYKNN